ncbi:MAG TPA: glycerol-3-phosphate dehydrogenase [Hyphomicrobiales bacterium]|nr:glycerol-3-phosphate dehydrogenase [Hyphomicrobiales bacterium]
MYDLAIIGGGVNGCGIARDAAGRGVSVVLFEQGDLAHATSSASTKLVHGGLRYLEQYQFRLVREALAEREVLLKIAPHLVRPLSFVLPHHEGLRPPWMLRLGLFLYDHLGGRRSLPPSRALDLTRDVAGRPLQPRYRQGFEYSDCRVDDARLVVLNARDAADRGAVIHPRTRIAAATRHADRWVLATAAGEEVEARVIVNAAGPWVEPVLHGVLGSRAPGAIRLVQGSHIVVPKLYDHDRAYIFQNRDGRVDFAIPYLGAFTLIGTTDRDYAGDPDKVAASDEEVAYLCRSVSDYFRDPVRPEAVVWRYSGVRPLYDDHAGKAQEASRDYVLGLDAPADKAPLLTVFGGKITTYRRLAEAALVRLAPHLDATRAPRWTARTPLPGGDVSPATVRTALLGDHPFLTPALAERLAFAYGSRARVILKGAGKAADLGEDFGAGLSAREVRYLMAEEWAETAEDVLWRRTKLGLFVTADQAARLAAFMAQERQAAASAVAPS